MKPLDIAFVHVHDPADPHTWSGIPSAILNHLVRAGSHVEPIGPLHRRTRYLLSPIWIYCKATHRAYHPDREPLLTASFARQIERALRGRRFDAILATETFIISRLNRPEPITYWSDGVWDIMADYYYHNPLASFHTRAKLHERQGIEKAAHAVYSSDWAADGARRHYGVSNDKLSVIPFGPNLEISHTRADIENALRARRRDLCVLLFLGVDWERKGGQIALEAARLLNQRGLKTELVVVGCKVPGEKPDFVREVGYVSKRTVEGRGLLSELLRSSHFLILPTRAECSAIVFCEASAFGLPIVTTDTGGISTYVRHDVNGIRFPLSADAEEYSERIYRLFHDRSAYEAMSLNGWNEFQSRLNWESSVTSLLSKMRQYS
jgi:glycosyltransferase involved in cell wall biosynthesis